MRGRTKNILRYDVKNETKNLKGEEFFDINYNIGASVN